MQQTYLIVALVKQLLASMDLAEAAVLAAGYAPAIGFLHTGKPQSFVYDVADVFKFETVVPIAFQVAGEVQRGKQPAIRDPMGFTSGVAVAIASEKPDY